RRGGTAHSLPPEVANILPSPLKPTTWPPSDSMRKRARYSPEARSRRVTVPSAEPVATVLPSGLNASEGQRPATSKVPSFLPDFVSQNVGLFSSSPRVANVLPSGLRKTWLSRSSSNFLVAVPLPVRTSHDFTSPSSPLTPTRVLPSAEKARSFVPFSPSIL